MMIAFTAGSVAFFVVGIVAFLMTFAPPVKIKDVHVTILEIASGKKWEFDSSRQNGDWTYRGLIEYPFFSTGLQINFREGPLVIVGSYEITETDR